MRGEGGFNITLVYFLLNTWISRVSNCLYYVVSESLLAACMTVSTVKSEHTSLILHSACLQWPRKPLCLSLNSSCWPDVKLFFLQYSHSYLSTALPREQIQCWHYGDSKRDCITLYNCLCGHNSEACLLYCWPFSNIEVFFVRLSFVCVVHSLSRNFFFFYI